ncbi:hypothetical protein H8356DRAFT_1668621 [Neocallimastix lanati (nom. inval.)]|jgi:SPX domain protein involved in polyphosphate accumulation|uniref:SPX domain-containing protein n=1 Tax=Neocallimastix californiae TaxID=1754190 RepID=A0A1Y2EWM2_9FUNG|nr:hypothetical protein H8356DRAFT_1668621 [Neocallimastix sp. JGI-2020a]ORY75536.1 hypothetical protein LY90DRAFT_377736 [Neocallimastix californiae]|eukprot:ORY75536.1 hypothetical protein LY90DRAFT_377736 [Neocallimastix californiae]
MKFGNSLLYQLKPEWKEYYIHYIDLKLYLKNQVPFGDEEEEYFKNNIKKDLQMVKDFTENEFNDIKNIIKTCEEKINELPNSDDTDFSEINEELSSVTNDIMELDKYIKLNGLGFSKILKKHDRLTNYKIKSNYDEVLKEYPFNVNFNKSIIKLSKLFAITNVDPFKNAKTNNNTGTEHFVRSTSKYWVHENNITAVKCSILKHLPVNIYNSKSENFNPGITSIYFDNDNFDLYVGRLKLLKGAEAFRIRWYGAVDDSDIVYMERKINQGAKISESSHKERFALEEKYVNDYLSGKYSFEEKINNYREKGLRTEKQLEELERFSTEYQNAVINKGLKPVLRTFYNRIAFQYPDHARIRISLDTDLCMIREDNFGRPRSKENWRREDVKTDYPFDYLPDEDITRFPFGILEIKLQTQYGVKAPQWIEDLINSHLVEQVPKFSKFVHGVSVLNKDRVPLLPYWLPELDILEKKEKEKMINGKKNKNLNGNISLNVSIERKKKIEYCEPSPNKLANN